MLNVIGIIETSAGDIEALREVLAEMETASRAEPGCLDYTFCQEISSPNVMRINELWESAEALRAHFATSHMARFNAAVAAHPPRSMTLRVHELGAEVALPTG